jgi:hypothetical protein
VEGCSPVAAEADLPGEFSGMPFETESGGEKFAAYHFAVLSSDDHWIWSKRWAPILAMLLGLGIKFK